MFFKKKVAIQNPFQGNVIPLEQVPDRVFSQKLVGDGCAVIPINNRCVAPVDGVVSAHFETKHAICIKSKDNLSVLIHIGLDTVSMGGEGFQSHVQVGDKVTKGDLLITYDLEKIARHNSIISPVLITNMDDVAALSLEDSNILYTVTLK